MPVTTPEQEALETTWDVCRARLTANPDADRFSVEDVTTILRIGANAYALAYTGTFSFMVDMKRHARRGLSTAQAKGVLNCMLAEVRRQRQAEAGPETVDMTGLHELFARAGTRLRNPRITLQLDGGQAITLKLVARGQFPGSIAIQSGSYPDGIFYGRVHVNGTLLRTRRMTEEIMTLVRELGENPVAAAQRYAALTGNCCFCNLPLTDERSTQAGYGPVCAEHYHLPWGDRDGTPRVIRRRVRTPQIAAIPGMTPLGFTYRPTPLERQAAALQEFDLGLTDTTVLCQECGRVVPVSQSSWQEVPRAPQLEGNVCNACSGYGT